MKLTKKQEKEIWQVYDTWLNSYLNGDVETYDSFLDDDYHFIGSATKEEFLNRKDTTNFFADTGDQFAGKTEIRNESKIIEQFGELIFITHVLDGWFLHENDWNFYSRFRFSSILRKNKGSWRFIYQHFSIPDPKTAEGETIGYDKINEENQELREAIQRRTTELEKKNRELEVETALERIRAQAVAMKASSDLLNIVVTMRNEFIKLGHEAHYFWHMMWLPETYEKAMTSGDGSKIGFVMQLPRHIHGDIPQLAKWEKSKKPTVVYAMNVDEAIDYVDKMVTLGDFQNIDPQAPTHDDIRHIGGLTFIMARTTHGEIGYSLPGIVKNPPKEDIDILVKFAGTFDLAHQRFLDLQKAEKQAKETQVELSLERIRSRVAEMKTSSDLFDIVVTMRNEFMSLGHEADYFWHMKWLEDNYEMSMTAEDGSRLGMVITVPKFVHEQIESLHNWEKSNSPYFVLALNGKDAWDYIEKMNTHGKYQQIDPHAPTEDDILHIGGLTFIIARTTHGEIGFSLAGEVPNPPKESIEILLRFAKVFDLAYKRFQDLQKAEAQARETQIELALEKVRSRTMAMQHSDELQEASFLLDQQVRALGIKTWGCAFNIYGEKESTEWFGNEAGVLPTYTVPHKGIFKEYYQKGQKGESFFIKEFSGKACVDHYEYMSSLPVIGDVLKNLKKTNNGFPTYQIDHVAYFKYGYLLFITKEQVPDAHDVFKRFAKVFEQTYTRFLDLQKAEAQAREAKIEAALERTRTQSMLMQHSDELNLTAQVFHEQLGILGIDSEFSYLWLPDEDEKNHLFWATWSEDKKGETIFNNKTVSFPLDKQEPSIVACYLAWESDETVHVNPVKPDEVVDYFSTWDELLSGVEKFKPKLFPNGLYYIDAYMKYGCFGIMIKRSLTEDEKNILSRFSKEFQRTYTRFLDLEKAEAQTREAQIEAALERVRSRSMAMHKSEEIGDVAFVLFEQLKSLGGELWGTGFGFCKTDSKVDEFWFANENGIMPHLKIPNNVDEAHKKMYQGWKEKLELFSIEKGGKELKDHYKYMLTVPDVQPIFQGMLDNGVKFPKWQKWHAAYFKYGYMLVITTEPYQNETIFKRFAKVFEQAYTRFLDLQKAEAQAREAQIETALERVRSRSMAMHNSEELKEVIQVLYDQFIHLNVNIEHAGFILDYKDNDDMHIWLADHNAVFPKIVLPYFDCAHWNSFIEAKKKGQQFFSNKLDFEEKNKFYKDLFQFIPDLPEETKKTYFSFKGLAISTVLLDNVGLYIENYSGTPFSVEDNKILMRFGKVFQQSYTRFLDLQKAEAQAREAQIETALERVRSQSMGMQTSKDLSRVTTEMFNQLRQFGGDLFATGIVFCDKHEEHVEQWHSLPDAGMMSPFIVPIDLDYIHQYRYDEWKKGTELFSVEIPSDFIEQHFQDIFNLPSAQKVLKDFEDQNTPMPEAPPWEIDYGASFKHGYMLVSSLQPFKEKEILPRFAKVFEQAYTRFLDLQKAEAQARKAQIEASLERVRAKAMSMQNSDELDEVLSVLCEQFDILGIVPMSTHMTVLDFENNTFTFRETGKFGNRSFGEQTVALDAMDNWKETVDKWKADKATAINKLHFPKEQLSEVWKVFHESFASMPEGSRITPDDYPDGIFHTAGKHPFGYIGMNQIRPATEEEEQIVIKFANEFGMAYQRFLDLKKAEAQAREAQIETALEKVRSRTMAMQHSDELPEAANNLFLQVQALGIPAWSAGYCIWESEDKKSAWCNMSSEGEIQKAFSLPTIGEGYNFYKPFKNREPFYVSELGGEKLVKHYDFMKTLPIVGEVLKGFEEKGIALPTFQIFHIVYFTHGYLMFITYEDVPNEWDIFIRFGKVFEQTYTRFLDLKRAEAQSDLIKKEKERLEVTISELKATQSQLIQSEKMASLGELTAGIAHEIQNPLNFVNNFSEVSKELLDEMLEEIENGDMEEVRAIMDDVIQNLEKINYHGKRADGIVKGMLQHSRSSTGTKEPTDINVLADEYLRLAYHGLRAKDKSFNANLVTDFDGSIGNISIIPQDIGRVVLNLLTNAFYVVNEKKQSNQNNYEPTVSLTTKKNGNWVTISVKDNGNGIPQKVLEKIFQPFFTTKPTGQGTGLGLSMSYDIITKGHGGELKVNTKQGEGTEFSIILPIKS